MGTIPVGDSEFFFVPRSRHVECSIFSYGLKNLEVIFKVTFSLVLPWWSLKLPFQFSRKAMHLKSWPAAFELQANSNLDEMTSRIRGQAPKRHPKWRRPMTNFLLLWRGISLESDTLWKLKQR